MVRTDFRCEDLENLDESGKSDPF
eukprot:SAG22_NODE_17132_length_311_cov_0.655660_2_plen_23_part_01